MPFPVKPAMPMLKWKSAKREMQLPDNQSDMNPPAAQRLQVKPVLSEYQCFIFYAVMVEPEIIYAVVSRRE